MTNNLLKAIRPSTHILLVGDADQLPAVGAGNVLRDMIASGQIPVVRLEVIFSQTQRSAIIQNTRRINAGETPVFPKNRTDFIFWQS